MLHPIVGLVQRERRMILPKEQIETLAQRQGRTLEAQPPQSSGVLDKLPVASRQNRL